MVAGTNLGKLGKFFTKENPRAVVCLADNSPEWLRDAVYAAHAGGMPNDWIYEECGAACDAIDDGSLTDDDSVHEYADARVDVYTQELYQWAADMCLAPVFAAAKAEDEDCGHDGGTVQEQLSRLQYHAIARIARTMLAAVEANKGEAVES